MPKNSRSLCPEPSPSPHLQPCASEALLPASRGAGSPTCRTPRGRCHWTQNTHPKVLEEARTGPCFNSDLRRTATSHPAPDDPGRLCWRKLLCRGQEEVCGFNNLLLTVISGRSGLRKQRKPSKNTRERSLFITVSGTKTFSTLTR